MTYKRGKTCARPHPTRDGIKCWARGCDLGDQHWAMVKDAKGGSMPVKVTWRLYEEPK